MQHSSRALSIVSLTFGNLQNGSQSAHDSGRCKLLLSPVSTQEGRLRARGVVFDPVDGLSTEAGGVGDDAQASILASYPPGVRERDASPF